MKNYCNWKMLWLIPAVCFGFWLGYLRYAPVVDSGDCNNVGITRTWMKFPVEDRFIEAAKEYTGDFTISIVGGAAIDSCGTFEKYLKCPWCGKDVKWYTGKVGVLKRCTCCGEIGIVRNHDSDWWIDKYNSCEEETSDHTEDVLHVILLSAGESGQTTKVYNNEFVGWTYEDLKGYYAWD